MPEQKANPVIMCRTHLYIISVDLLLANYNQGEVSIDYVKINKNFDMYCLLDVFHIIQHCLMATEILENLNDL